MAPEFWELREAMKAADATIDHLLEGAGVPLRGRELTDEQKSRLAAVQEFINEAGRGRVPLHRIQEALSTSDFPYLLGMIDRLLAEAGCGMQALDGIAFGAADFSQLDQFKMTGGDVYDGRQDVATAFRLARGNN